jgi:hypothetical protein
MSEENETGGRFEKRLDQITNAVAFLAKGQQDSAAAATRSRIQQYEARLTNDIRSGEEAVSAAERDLAKAYDDGDGALIAKAQRALTEKVTGFEGAKRAKTDYEARMRAAERKAKAEASKPKPKDTDDKVDVDDANLKSWKSKNKEWYGVDDSMTKAAHDIDEKIRAAGVIDVGSSEYFEAIDRQMAQKYPDRLNNIPDTGGGSRNSRQASNSADRGRISNSVIEGWRRMGINVDDPKTIDRMVGHRQTAVDKGILPQEPIRERIIG